jgi:hypothetical protein
MKLRNKYSKQYIYIYIYIYINQKFEDQIWYNQQIIWHLNFSQLPEIVSPLNFPGKHFPENQAKFFLTEKCFLLTNFSNIK